MKKRPYILAFILISGLLTGCLTYAKLPVQAGSSALPSLANMLEKVTPAVVSIHAEGRQVVYDPASTDPILRHFFGDAIREKKTKGSGSGIIVDARQGYVLTNAHVVAGADRIMITLNDNRQFNAKLIGTDPKADIAVLQIPNHKLTPLPFTDSDKLRVGDFVVAIGNPYGLGQSVSSGIVSALGRNNLGIEDYENFIQTDAPINPGNSGGALINLRGELIGINTAILGGKGGGNVGIGFAIPSNMAINIMDQLINYGRVQRGSLGIAVTNLSPALAKKLNVSLTSGAVITEVFAASHAAEAGLTAGDIITHVNQAAIRNMGDVRNKIGNLRVGTRVELTIVRNGTSQSITTIIGRPSHQVQQNNFYRR
jgi:Do/DeqQ family serine protease